MLCLKKLSWSASEDTQNCKCTQLGGVILRKVIFLIILVFICLVVGTKESRKTNDTKILIWSPALDTTLLYPLFMISPPGPRNRERGARPSIIVFRDGGGQVCCMQQPPPSQSIHPPFPPFCTLGTTGERKPVITASL